MITQKQIKELTTYDHNTGYLYWNNTSNGKRKGNILGSMLKKTYMRCTINYKQYYIHRLVWLYVNGEHPVKIDHIDGNILNNKIDNLRSVSVQTNQKNRKTPITNKSGQICIQNKENKYTISVGGIYLGTFYSMDEAIIARDSFMKQNRYHKNHGR